MMTNHIFLPYLKRYWLISGIPKHGFSQKNGSKRKYGSRIFLCPRLKGQTDDSYSNQYPQTAKTIHPSTA